MAINFDKYILSTGTHYISNSGSDERKQYHGGAAGDQSGHEGEWKAWCSRPRSVVLRSPEQAVALKIAELSIAAALNNKIGYDQYQRTTYWTQLQKAGYDPSKITTACEEDCTAGVTANVKAAGFLLGVKKLHDLPTSVYSGNMKAAFVKAGFVALTQSKYLSSGKYLLPGDILLYEGHHAAANVTLGAKVREDWNPEGYVQLHPSEPDDSPRSSTTPLGEGGNGPTVKVTGNSVNVRSGPSTDYRVLGAVNKGKALKAWGFAVDGWNLVEYDGQTGWISGKYSEIGEA
ncbi:MAG: SH3 domain-containing protein [Clostridia bacterium]|nr:SH3 domain-containing protein [Clostridia bacterium]